MNKAVVEQSLCPLCQRSNSCAVESGGAIENCWCNRASFPPKDVLRGAMPSSNSCICEACIEKLNQEVTLGIKRLD
ncbi:cysteine-rich CWC family protein [Shewanella psychropiezotolerans]|uniref:Cysteine-rich CWC family protein n=1 Tax=Shewanella psychropiezotolerans TaxID=2593655 RepID=A0ABX5X7B4_9GAMM|nr:MULTISPECIES: cysteine-rich CWC family protein [Shewanella]MPY26151.1 cysteine-rich CWC family protein [Shewanella sp. YLB-07]QDO85798.1 cysteine-rich CWC family protein [Shewanella psychropiezotolerans]